MSMMSDSNDMMTLANTKSSSSQNLTGRLCISASSFVITPTPASTLSFIRNVGSPSNLGVIPGSNR